MMNKIAFKTLSDGQLVRRLNEALAPEGERLIANRTPHVFGPANVGAYFIVDANNIMVDHDVDLVQLARDLGVQRTL